MKRFFKSLKGKLIIGFGTAMMAIGVYSFVLPNIGTEIVQNRALTTLAIVGDSGIQSEQFKVNNGKIKKIKPPDAIILGDECYDDGCVKQKEFDKLVMPLDNGFTKWWLVRGNHSFVGDHPENITIFANKTERFRTPTGIIYNNSCILLIESSLWEEFLHPDEKTLADRKKTEDYISKWLSKCEEKLKIVGAHHAIYAASGSHKGYNTKAYKNLYDKYFANKVDYFFSGHNHVVEDNGIHDGVHHYTSGAFAKDDTCESEKCAESGFLVLDAINNKVEMVK